MRRLMLLAAIFAGAALIHLVPAVSDYLVMRWPSVALGGAAFLLFVLLADRNLIELDALARFHWLLLAVYLAHQFEEHGVDLLGRSYYFLTYAETMLADLRAASGFRLTPLAIYRTNTLFVWLPFLIAVWGHRRFLWPGLAAAGLVLTNALLHIGIALWRGEYNPGLGTAIVLFLPLALLYFRFVHVRLGIGWRGVAGGVLFGASAHLLLVLRIRFSLAPEMHPALVGVVALLPLIANALYSRLRKCDAATCAIR